MATWRVQYPCGKTAANGTANRKVQQDMPMKTQELSEQAVAGRYRLKKAAVAAVSLSLLVVAAAIAYAFAPCNSRTSRRIF